MDRAAWAVRPETSRGRLHAEPESPSRGPYQRDRDRIIHSSAFRKLQYKTQVFVNHEGDFYRTRLTHSIEVAQIARSIARALALDEDLAEALALAHDLGHPPFGHAGEDALALAMKPFGGFDHNAQSLKVVTLLESRYAAVDGLNLTWETLEGLAKHNGPVRKPPPYVATYDDRHKLELSTHAGAEAQVAALSDDIAYNNHDVDDGLEAGLFALEELLDVPLIGPIVSEVRRDYPGLDVRLVRLEAVRRMIGAMIDDVMVETRARAEMAKLTSARDVRDLGHAVVAFSPAMNEDLARLRAFLHERMYRHWRVNRTRSQARRILAEMFALFLAEPDVMPAEWYERLRDLDDEGRARTICDYVAGMTDRYAIEEHRRLFQLESWV